MSEMFFDRFPADLAMVHKIYAANKCIEEQRKRIVKLEVAAKRTNKEAAAPDMYKALERIVDDFEGDYVYDGVIVDDPHETMIDFYRIAKAALAKAKGE